MRIGGMDAANVSNIRTPEAKVNTGDEAGRAKNLSALIMSKNISQITDFEKNELPISDKIIIEAVEKANRAISGSNRKIEFSIHQKTKEVVVKVINTDTNEVVREIPPEKLLDMFAQMLETVGLLVDERR